MPYEAFNARRELSEFYPPPYDFLAPKRRLILVNANSCPFPGCVCKRKRGMGQGTSQTITQVAGTGASLVGSTAGLLTAAGIVQSVPVAGQIIGAALAITAVVASMFKGCGQTCILTTEEVNKIEPYLQQNLSQYLSAPVSAQTQQEALSNFNQLWQAVVNYCNQPSLASAGQRCISDRNQGSCAYKTSRGGWQQTNGTWKYVYPGANGSGSSCWNWFVGYHDPIANDPRIAELPAQPTVASTSQNILGQTVPTGTAGGTSFSLPASMSLGWFIPAALLGIGGILLLSGGRR